MVRQDRRNTRGKWYAWLVSVDMRPSHTVALYSSHRALRVQKQLVIVKSYTEKYVGPNFLQFWKVEIFLRRNYLYKLYCRPNKANIRRLKFKVRAVLRPEDIATKLDNQSETDADEQRNLEFCAHLIYNTWQKSKTSSGTITAVTKWRADIQICWEERISF